MAISAGTVKRAYDFQRLRSDLYTDTLEYDVFTCKVDVEWVTTAYATANHATFAPATAIAAALRDGMTPSILQACVVAGGKLFVAAAPTTNILVGAAICTNTTGTFLCNLLLEDWTTELTDTTALDTSTWLEPVTFQVTFKAESIGQS